MRIYRWIVVIVFGVVFSGCQLMQNQQAPAGMQKNVEEMDTASAPAVESEAGIAVGEFYPYTAQFSVYTHGTKRIFTAAMYLEQSESAYLASGEEGVVHVAAPGVTWSDFFATLPFSVSSDCLVTGTGQKFCSDSSGELQFFLNGERTETVLEQEIQPDDELIIRYE